MAALARRVPAWRRGGLFLAAALLAVIGILLLGLSVARARPGGVPFSVYASGLNNPRGLAFDSRGVLYVAEAGSGGSKSVIVNGHERYQIGYTGRVSRIPSAGRRETVLEGMPSVFTSHKDEIGPASVAIIGDDLFVLTAQGGNSVGDPSFDNTILRVTRDGSRSTILNYSQFSIENPSLARRSDPRADVPGGMPFGMAAVNGQLYTTDGNLEFVQEFSADGQPLRRLLEYPASNRVLTNVVLGPDGALYIAELGPWPYPAGSGRITRLTLDGQSAPAVTGLTTPIAAAFGPDGTLYAIELTAPLRQDFNLGRLLKIRSDGQQEVILDSLSYPTAMIAGPDDNLYISNYGHLSRRSNGQVLRVEIGDQSPGDQAIRRVRALGSLGLGGAAALVLAAVAALAQRFR